MFGFADVTRGSLRWFTRSGDVDLYGIQTDS